jgi:predicted nucleic acid-binding protein
VILVDSNVLIDLFGPEQGWYAWSSQAAEDASETDELVVNVVAVAEVAPRLGSLAKFMDNIETIGARLTELTPEAAFSAGEAFALYRERRRANKDIVSILPGFLIGGHAQTIGATILTRDPRFYRRYFPTVPLITPETDTE